MYDTIYKPEDVELDFHPIFDQIVKEFGVSYQIWRRVDDLGRWLSAAILNPKTNGAVIITLRGPTGTRTSLLSSAEIQQIRDHFATGALEDLAL